MIITMAKLLGRNATRTQQKNRLKTGYHAENRILMTFQRFCGFLSPTIKSAFFVIFSIFEDNIEARIQHFALTEYSIKDNPARD